MPVWKLSDKDVVDMSPLGNTDHRGGRSFDVSRAALVVPVTPARHGHGAQSTGVGGGASGVGLVSASDLERVNSQCQDPPIPTDCVCGRGLWYGCRLIAGRPK